jgi:Flp pilus assembly protein TadG
MEYWKKIAASLGIRKDREEGAVTAEAAVVVPMLVLTLFATADFGRAFYAYLTLSNAALAGAQYVVLNEAQSGNTTKIAEAAKLEAQNIGAITVASSTFCQCPNGQSANCSASTCSGYGAPRTFIKVTTSQTFRTIFPYPFIPRTVPINRTAILRMK